MSAAVGTALIHDHQRTQYRHPHLPSELWALRTFLALVFLGIGAGTLLQAGQMVRIFDQIGLGQWLLYLTGGLQVAGGMLVLIPKLAGVGSFILTLVMVGATLFVALGVSANPVIAMGLLIASAVSFAQTQIG